MPTSNPRVDRYIAEAAEFAQPLLARYRSMVRRANPEIEETIKWSMPFFVYKGANICHMAAFKAHCAVGFWRKEIRPQIEAKYGTREEAMGHFGRITKPSDLPAERDVVNFVRASVALVDAGTPRTQSGAAKKPRAVPVPADLAAALKNDARAQTKFAAFAPSHRREYIAWITAAKRPETRATRIATTVEWVGAGKTRNWKYERK